MHKLNMEITTIAEARTANMGLLTTNAAGATHWLTASPIR